MAIKFPKEEENFSPEDAFTAYKYTADYFLNILKERSRCEFFYWKSAGAVFLLSAVFFLLPRYGFAFSPFIGIVLTGFGTLLLLVHNMKMDLEYSIQLACCFERGLNIEKKYDYPARIFRIFEDNKLLSYRGNLLNRLFPLGFIALTTSISGVILASKVGTWLAVIAAFVSMATLFIGTRFCIRATREILIGN